MSSSRNPQAIREIVLPVDENDYVESINPSDTIELLQARLKQVQIEIANLNDPGANVIPFKM